MVIGWGLGCYMCMWVCCAGGMCGVFLVCSGGNGVGKGEQMSGVRCVCCVCDGNLSTKKKLPV